MKGLIIVILLTILVISCTAEQEQQYITKYKPIIQNETRKIVENATNQLVENLTQQNEELRRQLENTSQAIQDISKKLSSGESKSDGSGGGGIGENQTTPQNQSNETQQELVKNYFKRLGRDNETASRNEANTTNNGSVNIGDGELNITINPVDFHKNERE